MKHVIAALSANGYPKRFVIDASKPKWPSPQTPATAPDDKKGFCILPYVKGTTEPIKRILNNYNIKVALKPHHTIGNLFPKPKDPVPKDQTRGAIYSIPCEVCFFFYFIFIFLTPFIYHTKKNYKNRCFFLNYSLHITNTPLKLKHELNYTKITKKIYKHTYIGKKKNR